MEIQFLYQLQQQENNYKKLLSKISDINDDIQINRLKDEHAKLKEEYSVLCTKKTEKENYISKKRSSYKRLQESKSNYEKLIYTPEINSVKKLETLEKQIDDVQKSMESEKHIIEDLEKNINEVDAQIMSIKKKMVFIKKKYETAKTNKKEELDFLLNEKKKTEELIEDIKLNVDDNLYNEYIKMKERIINPISEIQNRKCGGCGMEVPAMDYEAVKSGNSLKCQNCSRILIYRRKSRI